MAALLALAANHSAVALPKEGAEKDEPAADVARGMERFAERKAWMDSLTPEERRAYRDEMSAFMAEQGLAGDRYALSAIRQVNPTNLVLLASVFAGLQADSPQREENIRSTPESLAAIAGNLKGITVGEADMAMLRSMTALLAADDGAAAIAQARAALWSATGENALAGASLAALLQVESGLPMKLLVDGEANSLEWLPAQTGMAPAEAAPKQEPFMVVPCDLGTVRIPEKLYGEGRWAAAVQEVKIKGFAALGGGIAILCEDGTMIRNQDVWTVDYAGGTYRFRVDHIEKGKVLLIAESVEPATH